LCQRYYEEIAASSLICSPDHTNTGIASGSYEFRVTKRATPTVSSFTYGHVNGGGFTARTATTSPDKDRIQGINYATVNEFGADYMGTNNTAITVDAEL